MIQTLYPCFRHWSETGTLWVYSDPHFGDKDLATKTTRIPDEQQLANINGCVGKKDTLILLGDIGDPDIAAKLRGYKVLVCGNHDGSGAKYSNVFAEIVKNIRFENQKRAIYAVCTESKSPWNTTVFNLADYTVDERRRIILASSAIPVVYEGTDGVRIRGKGYLDGGLRANTPYQEMYALGWRNLITVWLDNKAKPQLLPADAAQIHILPPYSLGGHFGTIWVNRSKKMLDQMRGYYDTMQKRIVILEMAKTIREQE